LPSQDEDLDALMRQDAVSSEDRLDALSKHVRRWRDLKVEIADLEERLATKSRSLRDMERDRLPELFSASGVDRVDVPADGNFPGAQAELKPFYQAAIPVGWPQHQKERAFQELDALGLDAIVKPSVVVTFDRGDLEAALKLCRELQKRDLPAVLDQRVNHQTLTAALKELCEADRRPSPEQLSAIGATVGKIVKVKLL